MTSSDIYDKIKKLEQVGVMRALVFLREGPKKTRDFEEVVSMPTWTNSGRKVMEELNLITVEEGMKQALVHSLTKKGQHVSDLLLQLLDEV